MNFAPGRKPIFFLSCETHEKCSFDFLSRSLTDTAHTNIEWLSYAKSCGGKRLTRRVYCIRCNYVPNIIADDGFLGKFFLFSGPIFSAAMTFYGFSKQKWRGENNNVALSKGFLSFAFSSFRVFVNGPKR